MADSETLVPLDVTIGGYQFRVKIPADQKSHFEQVAQDAEQAIERVKASGALGGPKVMAMALFQISDELARCRQDLDALGSGSMKIDELINRIDSATGDKSE